MVKVPRPDFLQMHALSLVNQERQLTLQRLQSTGLCILPHLRVYRYARQKNATIPKKRGYLDSYFQVGLYIWSPSLTQRTAVMFSITSRISKYIKCASDLILLSFSAIRLQQYISGLLYKHSGNVSIAMSTNKTLIITQIYQSCQGLYSLKVAVLPVLESLL